MRTPFALVLLTWNQWEMTERCLRLLQGLSKERWTIWVVDNGSHQGQPPGFEKAHPALRVLRLPENVGFTGGCNRGARAALEEGAEVIVFLNNDARVAPADLERLAQETQAGKWGILGGVNYRPSEPDRIFSSGQRFLWPFCRIQRLKTAPGTEAPHPVPIIIGSCFAVRRELFDRVGFLDERFFIYYEEADFCLRAGSAGTVVACHPEVKVWHEGVATFGEKSPAMLYLYTRNVGLFVLKHCPKPILPLCLASYALHVLLKSARCLATGRALGGKAVLAGFVDLLTGRFGKGRLEMFLKG